MNNDSFDSLALAVTPHGEVYLETLTTDEILPLSPTVAMHLREAFAQGSGHGLLQLGAAELNVHLHPSLAFGRAVGHLFMTHLCAVPDLETQWPSLPLPTPDEELADLAAAVPPLTGAEYLSLHTLRAWWSELLAATKRELTAVSGNVAEWLHAKAPAWNLVGRVYFHLAENKNNIEYPFAFLATYTHRVLAHNLRPQHLPLGKALQEYAGTANHEALLKLLLPIQKAAEESKWLKHQVDSGAIYHPLAWTPHEAYPFLKEIPKFEAAGILVRIPDWWKPKQPPRLQVSVKIGKQAAAGVGLDALMDFSVELSVDGEPLTIEEWEQIQARTEGLALIKGHWVEANRDQLQEALVHWRKVQRQVSDGLSFLEAMRLLAGATLETDSASTATDQVANWSRISVGDWLHEVLTHLREPAGTIDVTPDIDFTAKLRPYQRAGVEWLWWITHLGLGGCLADDMGLGKTVQVIALLVQLKRHREPSNHLLVVPASLIANWQTEVRRFAPGLKLFIAHPSAISSKELAAWPPERLADVDLVVTSYGTLVRVSWLTERSWHLAILDEAQAIKNPGSQQTRACKKLKSRVRIALTGTPVENRLGDLWSLFDFTCPGLLGSSKTFANFTKHLAEKPHGYTPLRQLVRPYLLRRLKTDKRIIADLPDKTELKAWCGLTKTQAVLYQQAVDQLAAGLQDLTGIERRGIVLAYLMRFKQICNHPSQWLGDGVYKTTESGKFTRLREISEEIAARQEKVLVFTQFREISEPLNHFLTNLFGRPGLVLHGSVAVKKRKELVESFQSDRGPPFFVLSLKAGGTGLNLTAAAHVIHFDRWWNPAVENQATDRAYRIGQKCNVLVHKFICRGTVEEKIDQIIESKQELSKEITEGGAELLLTEMSNQELLDLVALDINHATGEF